MKLVRTLSVVALAFTLAVVVWGGYVRASGSGAGCGDHWPLCNGEVVPRSASQKTLVELTHRVTSALSGLLVVALVLASRRLAGDHPVRRWALVSLGWMLVEGAAGAALVRLQLVADNASANRAVAMGIHLVITFFLLGAMALAARSAWREGPARPLVYTPASLVAAASVVIVGISGSVAALGDTLSQQGVMTPVVEALLELRILHPVLALGAAAALAAVVATGLKVAAVRPWSLAVAALTLAQLAVGLVNVALKAPIPLQLIHLLLADLVWVALVLSIEARSRSPVASAASREGTADRFPPGLPDRPR